MRVRSSRASATRPGCSTPQPMRRRSMPCAPSGTRSTGESSGSSRICSSRRCCSRRRRAHIQSIRYGSVRRWPASSHSSPRASPSLARPSRTRRQSSSRRSSRRSPTATASRSSTSLRGPAASRSACATSPSRSGSSSPPSRTTSSCSAMPGCSSARGAGASRTTDLRPARSTTSVTSSRLPEPLPKRASVQTELTRKLAAEVFGTFAVVFAGCGAIMVDSTTQALGHLGVALSFGLVIMVMIYAVGHVSGAHFNPAVTFAFALTRHFPWPRAFLYWGAQAVGAIGAAVLLRASLGNVAHVGATLPSGSDGQSFLWEVVLTVFLMFVIMAVATDTRAVGEAAAIAIGGTVGLDAVFGGPITGASMNPARSLGPAIAGDDYTAIWVYLAAPLLGAAVAAAVYRFLRAEAPTHVAEQ